MIQTADSPLVSVVLPTYNNGATIRSAVQSIIEQSWRDWELLVMDDGSTDHTRAEIASLHDERIILTTDGTRRGLSNRLNQGIGIARGSFVARMDGDDFSYPERIEQQLKYLGAHPQTDLAASWAMFFEHPRVPLGVYRPPESHEELCARMPKIVPLIHPTWMGRRDWFLKYPYDPAYTRIEDQDLLFRALPASRFACVQRVLLAFRLHRQISRVRIEALDQYYHLKLHVRYLVKRRAWGLALRVALSRGSKVIYRPVFALLGMSRYMHTRSLLAASPDEESRFRAIAASWPEADAT